MIKNYFAKYSKKFASRWLVLGIDLLIVIVAFFIAYYVRFNFTLNFDVEQFLFQIPFIAIIALFSFLALGSFKSIIRHTGFTDVVNIFKAVLLMSLLCIAFVFFNKSFDFIEGFTVPRSIIVIHAVFSFVALCGSRLFFKMGYNYLKCKYVSARRVLIYGSGNSGIVTYNALSCITTERFTILGFIDNNSKQSGKSIDGISILSKCKITQEYIDNGAISEIIVTSENASKENLIELMGLDVKITKVPPIDTWIKGELKVNQIKRVQIEDLLGRPPITIDNPKLIKEFEGETVLVTGAAGSIGSELVNQLSNFNVKQLILVDQAESALYNIQQGLIRQGKTNFIAIVADVRDRIRMDNLFQDFKPTLVFHAAAYKHVPLMEVSPYEAIKINVRGTKVLADAASRYLVKKFVFISTDKAVNPTSVMGATKRMAEMYISCLQKKSKTKFITTRFGNVLGSNGSVIPLFKQQIEAGGPLTLTHEKITRFFMTIPEASRLVLEAGTMASGGEIFIFDMGESVKIFDLAKNMIKLSGLRYPEDIDIKITGLRPGEKLYEELLANGENTLPTYHKKIMISKTRKLDYESVKSEIEDLCVTNRFHNNNIVLKMKRLIPEYISNNSTYEEFDRHLQEFNTKKMPL